MRKPEKIIIYNLFPLLAGNVGTWERHLARAAGMGFNWLFVNPISLPGFSGSLYSIKDYFDFNPLIIDSESSKPPVEQVPAEQVPAEQVKEAFDASHKLGLSVMVDLVINHCAVDSPLIKEHPEWFEWEGGKVAHPFAWEDKKKVVWGDLAKFNHAGTKDKEGLYNFVFKVVEFLVSLGVSGFRCDAAYQVPGTLWKRLIKDTKRKYPDALFFAETLGCTPDQTRKTASAGFDYIFNSSKWWDMRSHWLMEQYNLTRETAPSVSFPESHDTLRLAEEFGGNVDGLKQRYLFSALFSAGVMVPMGYEFGFRRKPHVVKTRPEDWEENTGVDLTDFIRNVNHIKASHPVFQEEAPTGMLSDGNPNVLLMWKASTATKEEALVIINKDILGRQHFYSESLYKYVQSRSPLKDVSPEYPLDYIPSPFSYELRPGQGIVLVTERNGER